MVVFYYKCWINEVTTHSPFEVMYGYQPSTPADRLSPMVGATASATARFALIVDIRDVVNQLVKVFEESMAARSTRTAPIFCREILFIFRRKGYTSVHRNATSLEIRIWVITKSYLRWVSALVNCCYLRDVDYTLYFITIY